MEQTEPAKLALRQTAACHGAGKLSSDGVSHLIRWNAHFVHGLVQLPALLTSAAENAAPPSEANPRQLLPVHGSTVPYTMNGPR